MRYCSRCVYPEIAAIPLSMDEQHVCSGCRVADQRKEIDWDQRWKEFEEIIDEHRSTDGGYDVLIPVSGGKDSYYQTHVAVKRLGLRPLLMTYHGNNFLPEGEYNLFRMREVFKCDHVIFRPSTDVLIRLNRIAFFLHGDMNWHNHCGIETTPIQVAVQHRIPLILWGEHGGLDLGGMFSMNDYIEFTKKYRIEHALHGYDWHDFTDEGLRRLGREDLAEGLTPGDLKWAQYPSDDELLDVGVRGIYLGNYVDWDANRQYKEMVEQYNWKPAQTPFERTYRNFSNLDDMHENGAHDYLKYVKFGYGRATDHACKDIRSGYMTRDQGVEMVKKYDHIKPMRDLTRWFEYTGVSEEQFDQVADTFRDPRVWRKEGGAWVKDTIWGEPIREER